MNMITVTLQYGDNYVDVEFPCSDNYLQSRLNELHYEGNFLQHAFVHEVIEPKELSVLEKTFVSPDELNYLAKRMDSFWGDEEIQFYEAAKHRGCATPKDLINMTFNLQKYTLIRDISNLGKVGQDYLLNTQGSIPAHDDDNPKYAALARELLSSGKGIVTDSGLLFDNPELEFDEVYDGHVFPPYYYDNSMLSTIRADYGGRSEYLYLPCESISIQKALMRLGASEIKDVDFSVEDCMFESQEWNDRIEDTEESVTIYLEKKKADVSITADAVDGTIYKGSTIMVSAEVVGDANMDFTPSNPLTVTMTATRNGGSVFATESKSVICPAGSSNLVWFAVDIPETGYSSDDIKFTFKVSVPSDVTESSTANNTITKNERAVKLSDRQSPDASFELTPPSSFSYSEYKTKSTPTLSWSVWEWNGGFVQKTYTAKLTLSASLIPDASAGYRKESGGKWTTRSGYGLNTEVTVGLIASDSSMVTGEAKVTAYYPEFNYSTATASSDMLELVGGKYVFKVNDESLNGSRYHATPIWFPDGVYSVKYHPQH